MLLQSYGLALALVVVRARLLCVSPVYLYLGNSVHLVHEYASLTVLFGAWVCRQFEFVGCGTCSVRNQERTAIFRQA